MSDIKTVIYIDVLLLVNFLIAVFLLLATGLFCSQKSALWRLLMGGGSASLATLVLFAPVLPFVVQLSYQAFSAAVVVSISYGCRPMRHFLRLVTWYYLLNLLLVGVVTTFLMQSKTAFHAIQSNNLSVYCYISPGVLITCVAGVYLILKGVAFCFFAPKSAEQVQPILLVLHGKTINLRAFYDTGFGMHDPFSNRQVLLVSFPSVQKHLPTSVCAMVQGVLLGQTLCAEQVALLNLLPCDTIAGHCLLPAVRAQYICLEKQPARRAENILVAFCQEAYFGDGCSALFGSDLAEVLI